MTEDKASGCGCGCGVKPKEMGTSPCQVKAVIAMLVLAIAVLCGGLYYYVAGNASEGMPIKTVTLVRGDGTQFPIKVEVARTMEQQSQGLMHRTELLQNTGMLFAYNQPQQVRFWMKNTLIPLDMLFILPSGVVFKIVSGAKPHDETPIPSETPVIAVLELKGGEVKRMGITVGDKLSF